MWGAERCGRDIRLLVPRLIERRNEFDIFVKDYLERNGVQRSRKFKTLWDDKKLNTQNGTQEVKGLFGEPVMSFPKPLALLRDIIQLGAGNDDVVLDFFAGSGTTAHAVMEHNAETGAGCRFILVQLPEPLDVDNKDQKIAAQYCAKLGKPKNIAELTKERLRLAASKIANEGQLFSSDLGFRVFKLDTSNIRAWMPNRDDLSQALLDAADHLTAGRSEQDLLYEILLKLGLGLAAPIETKQIASKTVYSVGAGVLVACFAERIVSADVESLATGICLWNKELAPVGDVAVVFRDSAFEDDVAKTNLTAILQQGGLSSVRSV